MKNSTVLTLAAALLIVATVGCRTNPKVTPLPTGGTTGDGRSGRNAPGLDTAPVARGNDGGIGSVTPAPVGATGLPDDSQLDDREMDRTRFAAQTVLFGFDRSDVGRNEAGKIEEVASQFKSLPAGHDLLIEGHCDERGTEEYNRALGERRALAIRELLIAGGIDGKHVFTRSFGKDRPADPGHDDTAYGKNRRGEFILVLPRKISTTQSTQ